MPANSQQTGHLVPDALYPMKEFLRIAGISRTTMWRIQHGERLPLKKVRAGGKVYVKGSDGIAWILARAERTASK